MQEGFDREFYRSRWQRVLPLGPDGIQPYVRAGHGACQAGAGATLRRLGAMLAAMTPGAITAWGRARTASLLGATAIARGPRSLAGPGPR
jgi:hypothetical protein